MTSHNVLPMYTLKVVRARGVKYPIATCPDHLTAVRILQSYLWEKDCEHLVIIMLDGQHNLLGMSQVAQGGIHGLHIAVRDVFKTALVHNAHAIILSHNHPSGDTTPSPEDRLFTARCVEVGTTLGCPILDHIIISSGIKPGYYSMQTHLDLS